MSEPGRGLLTTPEAAARLGVKRQTIYAYVSRGMLTRTVALDGRTSLFDPDELDTLRLGRGERDHGELRTLISTAITRVDDDALFVRGHDLVALVTAGIGFVDLVDLVWQAPGLERSLRRAEGPPALEAGGSRTAAGAAASARERWPEPEPGLVTGIEGLDGLRSLVAAASAGDPMRHDLSPASVRAAGRRIIVAMTHGLPVKAASGPDRPGDVVGALWRRLTSRRPKAVQRCALDIALGLLVDHGMAGSTFAARIAASVRADPYSVVTTGLGAVGGLLHGAASVGVHQMFDTAARRRDPAAAIGDLLRAGDRIPGFGHAAYRERDPREAALWQAIETGWSGERRLEHVDRVRAVVMDRSEAVPNVDLALGALTWLGGMAPEAGETIFAVARTAGWLAHAVEEYGEAPLRFRPKGRYTGPG